MDLPFEVIFYQNKGSDTIAQKVESFVKDERDLYKGPVEEAVVITENLYLSVDFQCDDDDARFHTYEIFRRI